MRIIFTLLLCLWFGPASAQWGEGRGWLTGVGWLPLARAPVGGAYTGPGDIQSGALAWYGLRGYNAAYSTGSNPAVDLVDQAGANTITINILANGNLDTASISAWVTAHSVTTINITRCYDQSGNGNHAVQATLANMPTLTLSGLGSLPIMTTSATPLFLLAPTTLTAPQPFSMSGIADRTTGASLQFFFATSNTTGMAGDGTNSFTLYAGNTNDVTAANNAYHAVQGLFNGVSSSIQIDGTLTTGQNAGAQTASAQPVIGGGNSGGGFPFPGNILEVGIWSGDQSSHFSAMNSNQHTYWGF